MKLSSRLFRVGVGSFLFYISGELPLCTSELILIGCILENKQNTVNIDEKKKFMLKQFLPHAD